MRHATETHFYFSSGCYNLSLLLTKYPHLLPPASTIYIKNSDINQAKKIFKLKKRIKTQIKPNKQSSPPPITTEIQFGPKSFSARSLS